MRSFLVALGFAAFTHGQYTATYDPTNLPDTTEKGQIGTNKCSTKASQTSLCQNVYINSVNDFCLWAPPYTDGHNSSVGQVEEIMVAWCLNDGYGTRLIPDGTITGAHFVQTPDYVQVTGWGDLTKLNIPKGDSGGADGLGNPHGGLVFGKSYGKWQQYHEWTNFMSSTDFCIRACRDDGNDPKHHCNHIYDLQGCDWNIPANYTQGVFEDCQGDTGLPMGIYGSSTFQQGQGPTPAAHPIPPSSSCKFYSSVKNAVAGVTLAPTVPTAAATTTVASVVPGSTATSTAASSTGGAVGRVGSLGWTWAGMMFVGVVGAMLGTVFIL
ncbi:carbohydrate-binding module family 13 protein, partial [Rhizoctonia solani]